MDNINYIDMPVSEFTAALASSSPAPGGGGASALAAALGASLGCMVGELTVGKPKYAANEPRLRELIAEAQSLRERLLTLVDADAEAFLPLAEAYRLPKDAPDRGAVMEKCLADAAAVPMEILDAELSGHRASGGVRRARQQPCGIGCRYGRGVRVGGDVRSGAQRAREHPPYGRPRARRGYEPQREQADAGVSGQSRPRVRGYFRQS